MSIDIRGIIESGEPIDWNGMDPRDRTWLYIEKYKRGWLPKCRKFSNNWEEAWDLFADVVILKAMQHSLSYDEFYGTSFTTWMHSNLYREILKAGAKKVKKYKKHKEYVEYNSSIMDDGVGIEHAVDVKLGVEDAMKKLKEDIPQAYDVFVDFTLNNYTKNQLKLRYRCSLWLINELIDAAKRYLQKCLTDY